MRYSNQFPIKKKSKEPKFYDVVDRSGMIHVRRCHYAICRKYIKYRPNDGLKIVYNDSK